MATSTPPVKASRGGRPRDPALDGRILAATISLLPRQGIEGTSMDDIAERAGVSKPTIYRRWPSKEVLVIEALAASIPSLDGVDGKEPRAGLVEVVRGILSIGIGGGAGMMGRLADPPSPDPDLAKIFEERVVNPQREVVSVLLSRAIEEGSLPPDADVSLAIDLLYGAAFFHRAEILAAKSVRQAEEAFARRIVALLWRGLGGSD